jgi:Costars
VFVCFFKKEREKIRGRRRGGVEFMDKQIRQLIIEIKRLSGGSGEALGEATYGVLFSTTVESMPALSATLACAKKRGVIKYDG